MLRRVGSPRLLLGVLSCLLLVLLAVAWSRSGLVCPDPTLLLRDRHGRFVAEVRAAEDAEAGYWKLAAMPERVVAATLAVEDRRFRWHPGIDPVAAVRACLQNLRAGRRVSGASTIAMQVARMQDPGSRSYLRKTIEAVTALFLTVRHGREEVLAHYLRLAPYGNSIHGIAYASRRYLDKPVEDLSWAEVAFLTAIPQAPGRMNPFHSEGRQAAIERGERILELLLRRHAIDPLECAVAREQIQTLAMPPLWQRPEDALHLVVRLEQELQDPAGKARLGEQTLFDLAIDLDLQGRATRAVAQSLRAWEGRGAGNAALMIVDPMSREVLASVGSAGFFDDRHAGAIDYTRVPRSPGSLLKPFLYADALEQGVIGPATILDDVQRGAGGITNADGRYLGPLLPRVALANSRNVPAVNLLNLIGIDQGAGFLKELGLGVDGEAAAAARSAGLGLAIGGMPITLEQVVRAYTVLSSGGVSGELVWCHDGGGAPLRPALSSGRRLLSEATARQITLFLSDPMARLPSFPRMGATEYPFPVAVKTGTSTNYRDAWAVAYSQEYLVGAWVGRPDSRPMDRLGGALSAAELTREVMLGLHPREADGLEDLSFPPPEDYAARRVCALTGELATPACSQVFVEWFPPGGEPVDPCAAHRRIATDMRNGAPVSPSTPAECVVVRSYVDLAPRYAAWAARAGLPRPPGHPRPVTPATPSSSSGAGTFLDDPTGGLGGGDGLVRVKVTQPESGARLLRDPETPAELATVALEAVVDPPVPQVVWYVDGAPYKIAAYPYSARWPVAVGEHVIEARLAHTAIVSNRVRIEVE